MQTFRKTCVLLASCLIGLAATGAARADFLTYQIPGTPITFMLQGRTQVNPGGTVTFTHPTLSQLLYFDLRNVSIRKAPTTAQEFNRKVGAAKQDAELVFQASL